MAQSFLTSLKIMLALFVALVLSFVLVAAGAETAGVLLFWGTVAAAFLVGIAVVVAVVVVLAQGGREGAQPDDRSARR